jgi:hypothetical protein
MAKKHKALRARMIEYDPNTIHEQVKSYTIIGTN